MPHALTGNDVVDLGDPHNHAAHERPRFVARVLADEEREALRGSAEPAAMLWSLYAAKEAAYKLVCKRGPRPAFAHRRFVVDPSLAWVRYGPRRFRLWVERDGDRLHAIASTGPSRPFAVAAAVDPAVDAGVAVRRLLSTSLARHLRCSAAMLAVVRDPAPEAWDDLGPPRLLRYGLPLATDVSLSHDGRFVAFSACLPG
jgi:phosphopantetheinyl transferase (holo-ACP synthase)